MSIKIHTGFVMDSTDFMEIHEVIQQFRQELGAVQRASVISQFAHQCAEAYDRHTIDGTSEEQSIYGRVWNQIAEAQHKVRVKQVKDPSVDFSFSIVLFPFEGKFYGMFYTVQPEFAEKWLLNPLVDEFMYWNNTDPLDGVSDEEWEERGRIWNEIMGDIAIPSLIGITYEVTQEFMIDLPRLSEVADAIPSLEKRAFNTAKDTLFKEFAQNRKINDTNVVKVFGKYVEYLDTPEGSAKLELERQAMLKELRLTIGEAELSGKTGDTKPKIQLVK